MQRTRLLVIFAVLLALIPLSALGGDRPFEGAVYVMSNAPEGNEVIVFHRDFQGNLAQAGAYATAGLGTGGGIDPLASQGSLILSRNHRWLFAANAGSDDISSYKVNFGSGRVRLTEADAASGNKPIDIATTADGRFLYALNAADGTVGIFGISPYGTLKDLGTVAGLPLLFAQGIAAR